MNGTTYFDRNEAKPIVQKFISIADELKNEQAKLASISNEMAAFEGEQKAAIINYINELSNKITKLFEIINGESSIVTLFNTAESKYVEADVEVATNYQNTSVE